MRVDFYNLGAIDEEKLFYAIIVAQYKGEWLFVQQKDRSTWEIPAGRKEVGESIFETAQRELYEETGALDYELKEVCDYSVTSSDVRYGRLFVAKIKELGSLPESEIFKTLFLDELPAELTYPEIQPLLFQQAIRSIEEIVLASEENMDAWVYLGILLWSNYSQAKLRKLFLAILQSEQEIAFLCKMGEEYVGFINASIRLDYVEGANSSPVGYIEGIYVKKIYRKQGIAERLIKKAEAWANGMGCTEMASDIELDNFASFDFHKKVGFKEANRIICFIKDIN